MNDNTILRIKVPAHLYESVKEQLTLKEAKGKAHYGAGMEVVKEKKMKTPKDGMHQVEEKKDGEIKEEMHDKKERSLDELMKAKDMLEKKIEEMENAPKVEENEDLKEYVGMSPDQLELVDTIGKLIAGGAASASVVAAYKTLRDWMKSSKKPMDDKEVGGMDEAKEEKKVEDKLNEAKDKEKKEESFEVVVHKNNKKVSRKDYNSRKEAESAFETASKDLKNDVYLNDEIGRHIKIRKAKKEDK